MGNKLTAIDTAKYWIKSGCVIIDTETTGLDEDAQIVEVAAIDMKGNILLNCLVKPDFGIPAEATAIHGITNDMVSAAKTWPEVLGLLICAVGDGDFIAYNSAFDSRLIKQTTKNTFGNASIMFEEFITRHQCAMLLYAEYRGEPGRYDGYKWHKLVDAAAYESVKVEGQAHRALADCQMTLGIINAMAQGGEA